MACSSDRPRSPPSRRASARRRSASWNDGPRLGLECPAGDAIVHVVEARIERGGFPRQGGRSMRRCNAPLNVVVALMAAVLVVFGLTVGEAQQKEPLRVGLIQPLSGPIAAAGSYIVNGAKIALDRVNGKGGIAGRRLELIIEDNKSDPAETRNAAEKLIVRDKVPVIIGAWGSSMTLAMMPLAAQHGVPLVVETSSSGKITDPKTPGQKVVSRISPTSELEAVGVEGTLPP